MNISLPRFLLVMEDSDEDFDTVLEAARDVSLPHEIYRATTSDECLRLLAQWESLGTAEPALVMLDLNTPGSDGREALRGIRNSGGRRSLPVVVLSASTNPRDVEFCYAAGANAYHTKPVQYPDHLKIVRHIFEYWLRAVVPSMPPKRP